MTAILFGSRRQTFMSEQAWIEPCLTILSEDKEDLGLRL